MSTAAALIRCRVEVTRLFSRVRGEILLVCGGALAKESLVLYTHPTEKEKKDLKYSKPDTSDTSALTLVLMLHQNEYANGVCV